MRTCRSLNGAMHLQKPSAIRGLRLPIDFFFRQLAEDQKERSIGIILSGMGSDGANGIRAIKEKMGMAMAQNPKSAKYNAMPQSAIDTGLVDYVAPVEELPGKLMEYVRHAAKGGPREEITADERTLAPLSRYSCSFGPEQGTTFLFTKRTP